MISATLMTIPVAICNLPAIYDLLHRAATLKLLGIAEARGHKADMPVYGLDLGSSVQVNAQSVLRRRITFAWLDSLVISGQAQMTDSVQTLRQRFAPSL